jgi:hypothetical protein
MGSVAIVDTFHGEASILRHGQRRTFSSNGLQDGRGSKGLTPAKGAFVVYSGREPLMMVKSRPQ